MEWTLEQGNILRLSMHLCIFYPFVMIVYIKAFPQDCNYSSIMFLKLCDDFVWLEEKEKPADGCGSHIHTTGRGRRGGPH